jgi:hypothetical protein
MFALRIIKFKVAVLNLIPIRYLDAINPRMPIGFTESS